MFSGANTVTTRDLFLAATLTLEQTLRGQSFSASLRSACSDVYILNCHLSDDQRKKYCCLLEEVLEEVDKLLSSPGANPKNSLVGSVTLSTLALQENSAIAQLKQKCALLSTAVSIVGESNSCTLKDVFMKDLPADVSGLLDKDITSVVPYILLASLCTVTENDLLLRRTFIVRIIKSCKLNHVRNKLLKLEEYLTSTIHQSIKTGNFSCNFTTELKRSDLCWDLRRVSPRSFNSNCDVENKTLVLLYYFKQCLQLGFKLGEVQSKQIKKMSALEFSTSFNRGNTQACF